MKRLFLFFLILFTSFFSLFALKTACLNSSLADLWSLAGGSVDITVGDAVERGFAPADAILLDSKSGRNINVEMLLKAEPDLVLGSVDTLSHVKLKDMLDELGIGMMLIKEDSFSDFLSIFRTLTRLTGRDDLYDLYGKDQEESIAETIRKGLAHEKRPRVLFIRAGSAFSSVRAKRAEDHFAAGIIEDLGAVNIADEFNALTESLSLEAILVSQPDKIIIVAQGDEKESRDYITSLFSRPAWRSVKAVKNGEVYFLSKELFHYKPNGRWAEAYDVMEGVLYGE